VQALFRSGREITDDNEAIAREIPLTEEGL